MPYVMDFNRDACVPEFARIAKAMSVSNAGMSEEALSTAAIKAVASLFADIGLPKTLPELGFASDGIGAAAEQALTAQRLIKNNPKPLDASALARIITAAFDGRLPSAA
jgi:alcohol dehydrogenase